MPDTTNTLTPYTSVHVVNKIFHEPNLYNAWDYKSRSTATGLIGWSHVSSCIAACTLL